MNNILNVMIIIFIFLQVNWLSAQNQSNKYYFYHPEYDYGSELSFNPLTTFINGSFDILRNGGHSKDLTKQAYRNGFSVVWENISDPFSTIEEYGWKHFVSEEIFPIGLNKDESQFIPNYFHHLIGGGMLYVKMAEWYDYHNVPYPKITAALTSLVYHYVNESMENNTWIYNNPDPVADLLIFDPLSILFFSSNSVKRFFSEKVPLYDWSIQPMYNPTNHHLENAGQQFMITYKVPYTQNFSVFCYYGIYGIGGLSYHFKEEYNISLGAGLVVNKLKENRRRESRFLTPELDGAIGFFYDRNRSVLTSLLISGPKMINARLNVYPAFLQLGWFRPGMFIGAGEIDRFLIGITFAHIPVGLVGG